MPFTVGAGSFWVMTMGGLRPLAVSAALLAACGWFGARTPASTTVALNGLDEAPRESGRIYKVTFMSLNASADGAFLERVGGFSGVTDAWHARRGGVATGEACAVRQTAEGLGTVQIHLVEDSFAEGDVSAARWVDECWNALHGDFGGAKWRGFDDFVAGATAFYYGDLSPVVRAAARDGTPFVGRRYSNPRDGHPMFVMFLNLPRSGAVLEFHSAVLDADLAADHFESFRPGECEVHHAAREPVAVLNATYAALYAAKGIPNGASVRPSPPSPGPTLTLPLP